jgi:hypothetical protein
MLIFDSEIPLFSLKMPYDFFPVPTCSAALRSRDAEDIGAPAGLAVVEGTTLRKSWQNGSRNVRSKKTGQFFVF